MLNKRESELSVKVNTDTETLIFYFLEFSNFFAGVKNSL